MVQIGNDWDELLAGEFEKDYYQNLRKFLAEEYRQNTIYPDMHDIFNALKFTPYSQVRAVILGQDDLGAVTAQMDEAYNQALTAAIEAGTLDPIIAK